MEKIVQNGFLPPPLCIFKYVYVKHKRKDTVTTTSVHTGSSMAKCHKIKQYLKKFLMNFRIGYGFS